MTDMTRLNADQTKRMRALIGRVRALEAVVYDTLHNDSAAEHSRYSSYRSMALRFNDLVAEAATLTTLPNSSGTFNIDGMRGQMDTVWPYQKEVLENVYLETRMLLATLEGDFDFAGDMVEDLANFIEVSLRSVMYKVPEHERDVQNSLETLLIGRGYQKGTDFDREAGKVEFSGKEYIPDFCIRKYGLAVEVKLLRDPKSQSRIVEEITADITAYAKDYENQLYVVYDLGCIQNVPQFKSDIGQCDGVRVVVVKQ